MLISAGLCLVDPTAVFAHWHAPFCEASHLQFAGLNLGLGMATSPCDGSLNQRGADGSTKLIAGTSSNGVDLFHALVTCRASCIRASSDLCCEANARLNKRPSLGSGEVLMVSSRACRWKVVVPRQIATSCGESWEPILWSSVAIRRGVRFCRPRCCLCSRVHPSTC